MGHPVLLVEKILRTLNIISIPITNIVEVVQIPCRVTRTSLENYFCNIFQHENKSKGDNSNINEVTKSCRGGEMFICLFVYSFVVFQMGDLVEKS